MKRLQAHAIAASLAMATGAISQADNGDQNSTNEASKPVTETATISSNYFDANWALFSDPEASQPAPNDDMQGIASNYFDANWRIVAGSRSKPVKPDSE